MQRVARYELGDQQQMEEYEDDEVEQWFSIVWLNKFKWVTYSLIFKLHTGSI